MPLLIKEGDSERDISRKLRIDLISRGRLDTFSTNSFWEGVSQIICEPTNRRLKNSDILFIDTGSTYDGYFCDFDRNYSIGKVSDIVNDVYEILWIATQSAIDIAKPGITLSDLWQIMVEKLDKYLPKNYSYGRFGHGMGLQLTEPPSSITFDNKMELVSNMVLTIEPSIEFLPGKIMVHEENIVITQSGAELLTTRAPYKIPEIL